MEEQATVKKPPMKRSTYALLLFAVIVLCVGAALGLLLHFFLPSSESVARTGVVADCQPESLAEGDTEELCTNRQCVWRESSDGAPYCTYPEGYGYRVNGAVQQTPRGYRVPLQRTNHPSMFGKDVTDLVFEVEHHSAQQLRVKLADAAGTRYQVPTEAVNITVPEQVPDNSSLLYDVVFVDEPQFGFQIIRRSSKAVVFDTTLPGLTFSDQYLQLTSRLASGHVYGLGEHNHRRFKHDMTWRKWPIFTRDVAPVDEWNLYGAQPFYMCLEEDSNAHGVLLLNSNAMEIILQPSPYPGVSFQVIGGILDFYFFFGPTPGEVVQQYTQAVGRPAMPPYWSLGFQLSRWGYANLTDVRNVVERNKAAGIPQDVQYGDIDYMESKLDFTYDRVKWDGLPDFVDELHNQGQRYIVIQDHCIGSNTTIFDLKLNGTYLPYSDGIASDIFIRDSRNMAEYLKGEVWPGLVYYPDFTKINNVTEWWTMQCEDFYTNWGVEYDALWIDMNEPSNFVPGSTTGCLDNSLNYPPYVPKILGADNGGMLFDKTICMDAPQAWGRHYDVHSLYGHGMAITSWNSLRTLFPNTRPLVLTRSQFVGTQKYAAHWLGDNQSLWEQMAWSIVGMLEYSLFGFSFTGADICGFWYATTEEMCQRWMQVGAFYPYARNHNAETWPDQDPAAFSEAMITSSRDVLLTRYKLLPFLYTLLHQAHTTGTTVVRPLYFEFATDRQAWAVDRQFLWGPSLLITPVLDQGREYVVGYFPEARWYDYYTGKLLEASGASVNLTTPLDKINLHVRGGHIIPWQQPANTTVYSRQNPMGLIVALGDGPSQQAHGSLFWDDGESFETYESGNYLMLAFHSAQNVLDLTVTHNNYPAAGSLYFNTIDVWGVSRQPAYVTVNGTQVPDGQVRYDAYTQAMRLTSLRLTITQPHRIVWTLASR